MVAKSDGEVDSVHNWEHSPNSIENQINKSSDFSHPKRWNFKALVFITISFAIISTIRIASMIAQYIYMKNLNTMPAVYSEFLNWTPKNFEWYREEKLAVLKEIISILVIGFVSLNLSWHLLGLFYRKLSNDKYGSKSTMTSKTITCFLLTAYLLMTIISLFINNFLGNFGNSFYLVTLRYLILFFSRICTNKAIAKRSSKITMVVTLILLLPIFYVNHVEIVSNYRAGMKKVNVESKYLEIYQKICRLAESEKFNSENIFIIPRDDNGSSGSAFIQNTLFAQIMIIPEIDLINADEVEILGVVSHELGHYVKNHLVVIIFYQLFFTIMSSALPCLLQFSDVPFSCIGLAGLGRPDEVALVLADIYLYFIKQCTDPLFYLLRRYQESEADSNAVRLGYGFGLFTYLKKISHLVFVEESKYYTFFNGQYFQHIDRLMSLNHQL